MGVAAIDERKYARLLGRALPRVITTDDEFDRMVEILEQLHFPERELTAEEEALAGLLQHLIQEYDNRVELPAVPPNEAVKILMEHRGLRQADLIPVLGSSAQVSDVVTGKRGISKAQAKKLAEFFGVSVELFI